MTIDWISGLAIYALIWWLTLFMVLPFGNRPIDARDVAKGQMPGAPQAPRLAIKMAVNTVLAGVVFAVVYLAIARGWIALG